MNLFSVRGLGKWERLKKIKVIKERKGSACDDMYMKSEIRIVDVLRERNDADVHILISSRATVGDAEQYKLIFYGQKKYAAYKDTLTFVTKQDDTQAEKREQLVHYIKAGLIPLLNKAVFAGPFSVEMKKNKTTLADPTREADRNY